MSDLTQHSTRPSLTLRPPVGWQALNVRELWQFRELFTTLATRDVKLRYRQTALGAVWIVLQPLISAAIFAFVFGRVANLPSNGIPYFLFAYVGLLGWNVFSSTLNRASSSLLSNAGLVSKVYFPRLILPLSTVFSTLIDFGVAAITLTILMAVRGYAPTVGLLTMPLWFGLLVTLALGFGLFASALMVRYRDVQQILPVVTQLLLYASPVAYAVSAVPAGRMRAVYFVNPLAGLLEAFRWSILGGPAPDWRSVAYAAGVTLAVFVTGLFVFVRMERAFADVI